MNDEPETSQLRTLPSSMSRRRFVKAASLVGTGVALLVKPPLARGAAMDAHGGVNAMNQSQNGDGDMAASNGHADDILQAKIRRALLAGPDSITKDATVAEMDAQGNKVVLRYGTNRWVCVPGNENIVGRADMCLDPMGMQWMLDLMARKPKPSNTTPGLIYMLNGALQHSFTDPFDRVSPPIPIGPHWMILWPFDATLAGLPTTMRDAGALVMFAGTPYAHLHICGSPWDGNEYRPGDRSLWKMTYPARPAVG